MSDSHGVFVDRVYQGNLIRKIREYYIAKAKKSKRNSLLQAVLCIIVILGSAYLLIGSESFMEVGQGHKIPYMSFWHAPWKAATAIFVHHDKADFQKADVKGN
jgi:hypothetical protein